jgi:hypothetical protein
MSDVDEPGSTRPQPAAEPPRESEPGPGRHERAPRHDERAPGHDESAPGHDKRAPGHDELAPGHDELARRADELAPGAEAAEPGPPAGEPQPAVSGGYSWTSSIAQSPAPWAAEAPPAEQVRKRGVPVTRAELIWAGTWLAIPAVLGVPLAFLWVVLGPHVDVVMTAPGTPDLADYNTEAFVAGDGRYALITAVTGLVLGAAAWILRRGRGPLVVLGLALGSLAGAWITWKLGAHQGEAEFKHLIVTAQAGRHFRQNMRLRATGLVYLQALTAVAVYVGCAAWSRYPDLAPTEPRVPVSTEVW